MENNNRSSDMALRDALSALAEDMKSRDIGAVIWDLSVAGFPFIPEVTLTDSRSGRPMVERVTGIYDYNGEVYAIIEGSRDVSIDNFYNHDTEVRPSVVTLTPDVAARDFGDPAGKTGFTADATLQEWLSITNCYYQSLNQD